MADMFKGDGALEKFRDEKRKTRNPRKIFDFQSTIGNAARGGR